jgi:iron complex outermembrane receptor protein
MAFSSTSRRDSYHRDVFLLVPLFFLLHSTPVFSQEDLPAFPSTEDVLEEELRYLKAETYVITPSRIPENIKKTASSISVVTDKQIRQMGAKHLADVLQSVPGMNYFYDGNGVFHITVRGDLRTLDNQILIMVNGHPLHENYSGGAGWSFDTMQLDNVKRIEILRSPASAVYGANALAGVINVITKEAEDIDGWEVTARGGSYDTQQYNLLYGKIFNELEVTFNYNYFNTHGYNRHIDKDPQTFLDRIFGTNASIAPARMQGDGEKYDASLSLIYKGFTFDGRYVDTERDYPAGYTFILNNYTTWSPRDYFLNLSYEKTLWEYLDLFAKVYRNHNRSRDDGLLSPPGAVQLTPVGPVILRDGMKRVESRKNNRTGFEIQATYRMNDSNIVLAGISYEEMKQYDVNWRANFLYTPFPNIFAPLLYNIIPLPSVRDLSDIQNYNRSAKRSLKAFFIEDIWDITDNLRLTLGVRYDYYSDFGGEVSPRVGLVWEYKKGYDLKLLYGHAYRAPSFFERYDSLYGNRDLDPEEIDTYEVSLGAEFTSLLSGRVTWYHSEGDNQIVEAGAAYRGFDNIGKVKFQGVEAEMKYDFGRGTYLSVNYNYQRWISPHINFRNFVAPRHTGNIMANIRLSKYLNWYVACHIEDGFRREIESRQDDMSGFAVVNTTLIAKKFLKGYEGLEIRGSIYNLLDKDYTSPAIRFIPNDTPRPGRNFMVGITYKF